MDLELMLLSGLNL